jgi:caffeoyl-CoA O-methyltransferase
VGLLFDRDTYARGFVNAVGDITDPAAEEYARLHSSPEPAALTQVMTNTREFSGSYGMLTGHLEGRFLKMLVAISGAKRVLEIGTYTGYSALSMAEALPPDGRITTCEIDERHAALARRHIGESPYADKIEVRVAPALETIASLEGEFDMVFIDADKTGYRAYYDAVLPRLSARGFIAIDNVLWSKRVIDDRERDASTVALRELNDFIASDKRVESVMVPIRDGVTLVRRV